MFEIHKSGVLHTLSWRNTQLSNLLTLITTHQAELLQALHADLHKESTESMYSELLVVTGEIKRFLRDLPTWMKPEPVSTVVPLLPCYCEVRSVPLAPPGCLIISPFNYPVTLALLPVVGALAGGNPVVLKPSELSSHVSELFAKLVPKYFERGVFQGKSCISKVN
jgi:aldehyde dehydrogenase (NAD+)